MSRNVRPIASLRNQAFTRKPGYLRACFRLGKRQVIIGVPHLVFSDEAWMQIHLDFKLTTNEIAERQERPICLPCHGVK